MTSRFETDHSPVVRAILNAYRDGSWAPDEEDSGKYYKFSHRAGMAAALRAVAVEVDFDPWRQQHLDYHNAILAIADELEAQP